VEDGKILNLLKPKDGEFYLIENFVRNPRYGYHEGVDPRIRIEGDEMRARGLAIVLENLSSDHQPPLGGPSRDASQVGKKRVLDPGCLCVGVRTDQGQIHLGSMRRKKGGFVGTDCPDIVVSPDCTNEEFFAAVTRAFQICKRRSSG
jgi:hypothetical protein